MKKSTGSSINEASASDGFAASMHPSGSLISLAFPSFHLLKRVLT